MDLVLKNQIIGKLNVRSKLRDYIALLTLISITLLLRLYNIEGYPRWYCDEGTNAHLGLNILEGIIGYKTWGPNFFPPFFDFIQGISIKLLGRNYFAVRFPAVVFSTLSTLLMWILAKRLLNNAMWVLLTTFLYSIVTMHIGRMGLQHNAATFFMLLTVLLLHSSNNRLLNYIIAGVTAGIAFISHYTGGAIAGIFIAFYCLLRNQLKYLLYAVLGASVPLSGFAVMGLLTAPQWFIYDLLFQATRPFDLTKYLVNIFLATPFGWEFKYPLGEVPFVMYGFTLVGAISSIYILCSDMRKYDPVIIAMILSALTGLLISKDIWWSFTLYLYPSYTMAFIILLRELYTRNQIVAMTSLIIPAILGVATVYGLNIHILTYYALLSLIVTFAIINNKRVSSLLKVFSKIISKIILIVVMLMYIIVTPLLVDLPLLSIEANNDKKAVLTLINTLVRDGALIAVPSEFLPLLKEGVEGMDVAQLVFCYAKKPQFLYQDVDVYLQRFRPKYCDPANYDLVVFTYDYGLPIKELTASIFMNDFSLRWPFIIMERHIVFVNPLVSITTLPTVNKVILPPTNITFAYAQASIGHEIITINETKVRLKALPVGILGWSFWKIQLPEPFIAYGDLLIVAKFTASTDLIRFVIKPIDAEGNEVLPWLTSRTELNKVMYASRWYRVKGITLGGFIVGFDWNDPDVASLMYKGEEVWIEIEFIAILSGVTTSLSNYLSLPTHKA